VKFVTDSLNLNVFQDFLMEDDRHSANPNSSIKYSTAMSLAARFPYISPVGRAKGVGQFMDAGYYDNIGGTVTRRLHQAFVSTLHSDTAFVDIKDMVKPVFLLITNNNSKSKTFKDKESINYQPQIFAPAVGVLNATFAQVEEMKKTFGTDYLIESKRISVQLDSLTLESLHSFTNNNDSVKPALPLGRYLSKTVIRAMEQNLISNKEAKTVIDSLLNQLETN
jgi:hypothetical protein